VPAAAPAAPLGTAAGGGSSTMHSLPPEPGCGCGQSRPLLTAAGAPGQVALAGLFAVPSASPGC
jgi:hypothetical protein